MTITLGLRPRIKLEATGSADDITRCIHESDTDFIVTALNDYVVVKIPESRRHYWSPQLQLEMEEHEDGTRVSEVITPMPAVWTLFAMSYIAILVLGFFAGMYGLAQWKLGHPAPALWSFPVALLLLAAVYTAAKIGQRIGQEQTEELTAFLRTCLGEVEHARG